jgi:PhzF family phenazine biosynthesis protein
MTQIKGLEMYLVDSFAEEQFQGNPAAVCIMDGEREDEWQQKVAAEMNASETAFLLPLGDEPREGYSLRWFSPAAEVDLCGHATLASAHVLWESGRLAQTEAAVFHTRSGVLTCLREGEWLRMDFPSEPAAELDPPQGLLEALGLANVRYIGANRLDIVVEVESEAEVVGLKPDYSRLVQVPTRGVIVTARADRIGVDFVSRFFCPRIGVNEDPVTGSAHCLLTPYWQERLERDELTAFQASARGGWLRLRAEGERVVIYGKALTFLSGRLLR